MDKKVVVVLGISRSGTSAVARSLKALGVDMGNRLLSGDSRNPKGFWEDADVLYGINRNVSRLLDYPWMTVGKLDKSEIASHPALSSYYQHAKHLLSQRLAETNCWGFKDPRTVTILPFWQSVFDAEKVEDSYVIVVRNPLAAAQSNHAFCGDDVTTGLLMWLIHLFAAVEGTHGKKRVVVSYELMLQDARQQLQRMKQALGLPFAWDEAEVSAYADEFIDKNLRHNHHDGDAWRSDPMMAVMPLCLSLFDLFTKLAKDEIQFDSVEFKSAWQGMKQAFEQQYPLYQYTCGLIDRHHHLKGEMRTIRKSLPWKLIYPLRLIDNVLRLYRRKQRELKRLTNIYAQ